MVFQSSKSIPNSLRNYASLQDSEISREAISKKFNPNCVNFFKSILDDLFREKISESCIEYGILRTFEAVYLLDSSSWNIHPDLKHAFSGFGGSGSDANCKIQLFYEYKSGSIHHLDVTKGNLNDQTYGVEIPKRIDEKSLVVFDLGYWKFETLNQIDQNDAYFLSRYNISNNLWLKANNKYLKFDLEKYLRDYEGASLKFDAYLKKGKQYIKVRFVAFRAPEEVANIRRMRLKKSAQKRGKKRDKKTLYYAGWTAFVTNAEEDLLPSNMIMHIYRVRWTIELIFKNWKSILKIHQTQTRKNKNRLLCEIYAKLIFATIVQNIANKANTRIWNEKKQEISYWCVWDFFSMKTQLLQEAITHSQKRFLERLAAYEEKILKYCRKIYQKSRMSTMQILVYMTGEEDPPYITAEVLMGKDQLGRAA